MTKNLTTKVVCPGQDTRFWTPYDIFEIPCGACGTEVEFYKDDARRKCPNCGGTIVNPRLSVGCAQWCEHAKECLGFDPKESGEEMDGQSDSFLDQLQEAVKTIFGSDQKRIDHTLKVLEYSRMIFKSTPADPKVTFAAALLHDIGIPAAEQKHGSAAARYQEEEGPPIAKQILSDLGIDQITTADICDIVANHHSGQNIDTPEFNIVWDADWLVNIPEMFPDAEKKLLESKIKRLFKTKAGREIALETFIHKPE